MEACWAYGMDGTGWRPQWPAGVPGKSREHRPRAGSHNRRNPTRKQTVHRTARKRAVPR